MEKGVLYRKIDKNRKNRNRNQGGYTLVELIVVICIVLILAGGAVFGVMTWIRWSQFKEQNEYAKTLFSAAQNHLTEYSENGQLGQLQSILLEDDEYRNQVKVSDLKNEAGGSYRLDEIWPSSKGKTDEEKYRGTICFLKGDAETYSHYQDYKNGTGKKPDAEIIALYDLLLPYVYDPSILSAAICVEFTPEDGQVFAVLYSNRDKAFEYNSKNNNKAGSKNSVDITNRKTSVRKQRMVGYYGVDSLSKATSTDAEKPSLADVKLNNGDTLDLSFRVSKVKEALTAMTYEITVCDKDTKSKKLMIQLDGTQLKNKKAVTEPVTCKISRYGTDGSKSEEKEFPVLAWLEENETIRVVLDAVDLSASSSCYNSAYELITSKDPQGTSDVYDVFKKTYSFHRFGVDTEDIFCTVKGSGAYYKPTAKKQSNSTNTYFASFKSMENSDSSVTNTYGLTSIRHLYNIRYREDRPDDNKTIKVINNVYQLAKNIDWRKFISGGSLYDTDGVLVSGKKKGTSSMIMPVDEEETAFPSITQMKAGSILESKGERIYTISGLTLKEDANSKVASYGTEKISGTIKNIKNGPVGLFITNNGELRKLVMDKITVVGTDAVGAYCGKNTGRVSELTVDNSDESKIQSTILGISNVGGILGEQVTGKAKSKVEYKELVNRASVTGRAYVGGIAGQLYADNNNSVLVEDSVNYGVVEAIPFDTAQGETASTARYIGGITGFCNNKSNNEEQLKISGCTSSPQYKSSELKELFQKDGSIPEKNEELLVKKLNGVYVGGIAGYSRNSLITDCNTEQENNREGFIFGYQFVGGIVGYNESISVALDGKKSVNEANVVGSRYVGGICGCNSGSSGTDKDDIVIPDLEKSEDKIIANWTNKGMVAAGEDYAGGIAGANAGIIKNCSSEVASSNTAKTIASAKSLQGDYAGGIAGYNNGSITVDESAESSFRKTLSLVSYISGRNYVGGIVGYNDVDASVEGYALTGGYIKGSGVFVGGYAGLNTSKALLQDQILDSNPNEVTGAYCVSGTIGGNIVATDEDLQAEFNSDNFLGNVKAISAFAGGFIGYNQLIADNGTEESNRAEIGKIVEQITENLGFGQTDNRAENGDTDVSLEDAVISLEMREDSETTNRLTIQGVGDKTDQLVKFGSLSAEIYIGGVVGYNASDTRLTISDVVNKTPVTAEEAIRNQEENKSQPDFTYSYAGGIIGRVGENVIVDNCSNQDVGDVIAQGTYLGGISEINDGSIKNCSVASIGSSDRSYVGGITGLNKGVIEECSFTGKTITGMEYVGGMAAENYGTIENPYLFNSTVKVSGDYAGGAAGYNYAHGTILLYDKEESVLGQNHMADINLISTGSYAGGIVGKNEGELVNSEQTFPLSGIVSGSKNVGGFAGYNQDKSMQYLRNNASVIAIDGAAGGIAGESSGAIENCINAGTVSATKSGDAGGIVSVNNKEIEDCVNLEVVTASNGDCGGITGVNNGTITHSHTKGNITFNGQENVGGISGTNSGTGHIQNCSVQDITVQNMPNSKESDIGAIAGKNSGEITIAGNAVDKVKVYSYSSNSNIGGAVGKNTGTITGAGLQEYTLKALTIGFLGSNATYANMGGVSGYNSGVITGCSVFAEIKGNMGSTHTGYGGVSGVNEGAITESSYDGDLLVNGSADNMVNLGGIAGRNNVGGDISHSYVGLRQNTRISSGYQNENKAMGYVGGMVGWNYGSVRSCDNNGKASGEVSVVNYAGHIGGIIGNNVKGAIVTGTVDEILSTGASWSVTSKYFSNDVGAGGIMGYSSAGNDISYVSNYADVESTSNNSQVVVGGLVGRIENNENSALKISSYTNYGHIKGVIVGGAIGRIKYKGAAFDKCVNYGEISGQYANISAGLVASFFANDIVAFDKNANLPFAVFTDCKNYGYIKGSSYAGGLTGMMNPDTQSNIIVKYSNCVNVGCIDSSNAGGIAGSTQKTDSYFYWCRNYGNSTNTGFSGIVNLNNNNVYKKVFKCFSISNQQRLTNSELNILNSYYLVKKNASGGKWKASVEKDGSFYSIKGSDNTFSITGLVNNPLDSFGDKTAFTQSETGKKPRQLVYEEVDSKVVDYYDVKDDPDGIRTASVNNTSGILAMRWSHTGDSYNHDQLVYRILDSNGTVVFSNFGDPINVAYGIEYYSIAIPENFYGKRIQAYIRSVNGHVNTEDYTSEEYGPGSGKVQEGTSEWVLAGGTVKEPLPEPKIYLELAAFGHGGNVDSSKYVAVLENKDEYVDGKNATIYISGAVNTTINTDKGRSAMVTITGKANNQKIVSYAGNNSNYAESERVALRSVLYGADRLKIDDFVKTEFDEFFGERPGSLYNQLTLDAAGIDNNITEMYVNSELVIKNYAFKDNEGNAVLNCDIAVASGVSHVTTNGEEMTSVLNNLPENLLDYERILVRTYPWQNQSYVCWYGHPVKSGISETDLLTYMSNKNLLKDSERKDTPVFTNQGLANGYVLRLNTNGTYDVIYSAILGNSTLYAKQIDQKEYKISRDTGKVTSGTTYSKPIQPVPVIDTASPLSDDGKSYSFIWDKGKADENAVFDLQLKGITKDGTEVLLETVTVDQKTVGSYHMDDSSYWAYSFHDEEEVWNYPKMLLSIVHVGVMDMQSQATQIFPSKAEQDFDVLLKLSQISRPTVLLHKNDSETEKNSLIYDITWKTVPEEELSHVSAYKVGITRSKQDEKATLHYEKKEDFESALTQALELYRSKGGDSSEELDAGKAVYTWQENVNGASVEKKMELTWSRKPKFSISKTLTENWIFEVAAAEENESSLTKILDLNDYERGELLEISVQALAADGDKKYRDGPEGVAREITMPSRLEVPDVSSLVSDPEYKAHKDGQEDTYITQEELSANGLILSLKDSAENLYQGKYQIAAAVYDQPTMSDQADVSMKKAGDAPEGDLSSDYWNSGSGLIKTLITKESQTVMDGNFTDSSYVLKGLDSEYAGKWLKVAVRSVSDSNISSWWSDEDDMTENSLNYKWIQIPRIQVEETQVTDGLTTLYYDSHGGWTQENIVTRTPVEHKTLRFEQCLYADGYRIQRVRNAVGTDIDQDKNYTAYNVDWIYLEVSEDGGYHVFCSSSDEQFKIGNEDTTEVPVCWQDNNAVYWDTIYEGEFIELPYTENVWKSSEDTEPVQIHAFLEWEESTDANMPVFTLVLPDAEKINDYVGSENYLTSQVSIQAVVSGTEEEGNLTRYESSPIAVWYRYKQEGELWGTEIASITDYAPEPAIGAAPEVSFYKDIAYQLRDTSKNWRVYQVEITEPQNSNILDRRYISAYGNGIGQIDIILLLKEQDYGEYAGKYISVRAADIITKGGVSKWSEWTDPVSLPELTIPAPDVEQENSVLSAWLSTEDKPDDKSSVDIQGVEYNWKYRMINDSKINGYQILIGENEAVIKVWKDDNGDWFYRTGDSVQSKLDYDSNVVLCNFASKTANEEQTYMLNANAELLLSTHGDGLRFSVLVPSPSVSCSANEKQLDFTFDSVVTVLPIAENDFYSMN